VIRKFGLEKRRVRQGSGSRFDTTSPPFHVRCLTFFYWEVEGDIVVNPRVLVPKSVPISCSLITSKWGDRSSIFQMFAFQNLDNSRLDVLSPSFLVGCLTFFLPEIQHDQAVNSIVSAPKSEQFSCCLITSKWGVRSSIFQIFAVQNLVDCRLDVLPPSFLVGCLTIYNRRFGTMKRSIR